MTTDRHHNQPETGALTVDELATVEIGHKAMQVLAKNFERWLEVGHALKVLRDKADQIGGSEWAVRRTFRRLREQNGFGSLDKARVSKLLKIVEHEGEVVQWHQTLTPKQQREWASPSTIIARCPLFKNEGSDQKPPRPSGGLKRQVEELTAERDEFKASYERARDPDLDEVVDMLIERVADKSKKQVEKIFEDIRRRIWPPAVSSKKEKQHVKIETAT